MDVPKRSELITEESLSGLYGNHPYLLLFQKENWQEYLSLVAQIYDLLEQETSRLPYEVIRTRAVQFYSQRGPATKSSPQNIDQKVISFFNMMIGELATLRDSHDHLGQRYIETTRFGKALLQLSEDLLTQRTKFTGTNAETLLAALNNILLTRHAMTAEEAVIHHREKIKSYQKDIQRIEAKGIAHAELLPMEHSHEALFNQAEEAAAHLLASIEDVKIAIDRNRQELSRGYFEKTKTAGQNLTAVADFYEKLYLTPEYASYVQAKNLLSFLVGLASRFANKNIGEMIHRIEREGLISNDQIQRSHLKTFSAHFENADRGIQEKIKSQLQLLQQQVHYAIATDVKGLQETLSNLVAQCLANKKTTLDFFSQRPLEVTLPLSFELGSTELSDFVRDLSVPSMALSESKLDFAEENALLEALLQAEETTLKTIVEDLRRKIAKHGEYNMALDTPVFGLAEYYVLSEIDVFALDFEKQFVGAQDLLCKGLGHEMVLRAAPCYKIRAKQKGAL